MAPDSFDLPNFAMPITYLNDNAAPPPKYSFQPSLPKSLLNNNLTNALTDPPSYVFLPATYLTLLVMSQTPLTSNTALLF